MIKQLMSALLALLVLRGTAAGAEPDLAHMTAGELIAFTRAMPKGGELHNHLSGAIFPETLLAWAAEDGLCFDTKALALTPPCEPSADRRLVAGLASDDLLRTAMIDSLSTRHPDFLDRSGHDQFFTAFGRFGATSPRRAGDMLAEVAKGLARQHTYYLEVMVTPQGRATRELAAKVGWTGGDLAAQRAAISAAGLESLVDAAIAETDAMEARARSVMGCGTPTPSLGCQVTIRYLVQTSRIVAPEQTFAQLQLGVSLVARDRRWVGLQMVAPEDHPNSLKNYSLHMRMVGFLTERGSRTPVALHAGELSLKYATPYDLSFHVGEAVRVAGARRVGHGVALPHEVGAEDLAAEMAAKGVLVEVNLTSNAVILEIEGARHPYAWLRQRGVPASLSTDDAGILRIDLSHEYARAGEGGATYADLKASARNALAFSFLAGQGLWADPGRYRKPVKACAGQLGLSAPRPGPCADLLTVSDKAREQWRHEALLKAFEKGAR